MVRELIEVGGIDPLEAAEIDNFEKEATAFIAGGGLAVE